MRSSNPVLSDKAFGVPGWEHLDPAAASGPRVMTVSGTVNAAFILISLAVASAVAGWYVVQNGMVSPGLLLLPGALGGLVLGLVMVFRPQSSPYLAPVYAVLEGAFLGALSLLMQARLEQKIGAAGSGIVFQAVLLTFGIFFALLAAYKLKLVRIGSTLQTCLMIGGAGVAMLYLVSMIMGMTGLGSIGFIHSSGPFGIAFSVAVVVMASMYLVLDFQFVESAAQRGSPKYMEWYAAYGLLATLVWLYIEILRLLSKIAARR